MLLMKKIQAFICGFARNFLSDLHFSLYQKCASGSGCAFIAHKVMGIESAATDLSFGVGSFASIHLKRISKQFRDIAS